MCIFEWVKSGTIMECDHHHLNGSQQEAWALSPCLSHLDDLELSIWVWVSLSARYAQDG